MCRCKWSRCFGPQMFTDTNGYRCSENRKVTDADAYRCFGPQMFTDTDGYRCLWFTDAYAERMPMHKVWMTEIPRFRQEISRFQSAQKPQSLNRRISSGQTYRPYICADADGYRCFGPQMFTDADGYPYFGPQMSSDVNVCRCLRLTDAYDTYGQNIYMPCATLPLSN